MTQQDNNRAEFEAQFPPLPEGFHPTPDHGVCFDRDDMYVFAQAAIEHDRKSRGEPYGYVYEAQIHFVEPGLPLLEHIIKKGTPVYLAPQPAEPVKGPSVPEYTPAMGLAGQAYLDSFKHAHPLPSQFMWADLWAEMCKAAAPTEPADGQEVRTHE